MKEINVTKVINGYELEYEVEEAYNGEFHNSGSVTKGDYYACLGRFQDGYPMENPYGEELVVPDATYERIMKWFAKQGW